MQTVYIILGLIIILSFVVGFIKTIWDSKKIKKNSVADDPRVVFDVKKVQEDKNKDDDLELL